MNSTVRPPLKLHPPPPHPPRTQSSRTSVGERNAAEEEEAAGIIHSTQIYKSTVFNEGSPLFGAGDTVVLRRPSPTFVIVISLGEKGHLRQEVHTRAHSQPDKHFILIFLLLYLQSIVGLQTKAHTLLLSTSILLIQDSSLFHPVSE